MSAKGWIGVDLDGTLAEYDGWKSEAHIGRPVALMVERVRAWLREGREVRVFTARVSRDEDGRIAGLIKDWLELECGLPRLEVTCSKDYGMVQLWDDRCVQVIPNTGLSLKEFLEQTPEFVWVWRDGGVLREKGAIVKNESPAQLTLYVSRKHGDAGEVVRYDPKVHGI